MDDSNPSDLFGPAMVLVWGVLAAAVLLAVVWKVHKSRSRRRRRAAARESKRQLHAWREGGPPQSLQRDGSDGRDGREDSIPH